MVITPTELSRVRYIDYDYWVELSRGTRLASDAAPRIRAGVAPFGMISDWVFGMASVALPRRHVREMDFTARPMTGMVFVQPAGLMGRALAEWIGRAAEFVQTLPPK
jgi:hypothetical protein